MTKYLFTSFLAFFISFQAYSQGNPASSPLNAVYTTETITPDGILDEEVWQNATAAKGFYQNFPSDSAFATNQTELSIAYDDDNVYIAIKCYAQNKDLINISLKRDFSFFGNDNVTVLFDTYNDFTNAFVFGMTPLGVRREAVIVNSGQNGSDFDDSWDNKWQGDGKIYDDHWTSEMVIPFKTLRFTGGSKKWRLNCYRYDTQSNEVSSWISIPQNRFPMDLAYMGDLQWEKPLKKTGRNISLIPYTAVSVNRDFENPNQTSANTKVTIGGDAKVAVSSGLNLDLTVNPDFSQVEVDQQVTNLDRFEIFFPERRQFFLENADLFAGFGIGRVRPFFSRRIGITVDPSTGQNIQNKIDFGARLSGKLNDNLRIGLLSMQSASQNEGVIPGFNFSVATAEQRISKSSRFAATFVNKQTSDKTAAEAIGINSFNRTAGLEYRLNTPDNMWVGKVTLMKTFTPGLTGADWSHFLQFQRNVKKFRLEWAHLLIGNNFNPEVGFAPRKDFALLSPEAAYNFYPKSDKISQITAGFDSRFILNLGKDGIDILEKGELQEVQVVPELNITFNDFSMLNAEINIQNIKLERDFDPTRIQKDGIVLAAGSQHQFTSGEISYSSDQRNVFSYNANIGGGQFYNGTLFSTGAELTYRYQPYGFVSLAYNYFRIALDEPFEVSNLWLIGPRVDLTFSKSLFLTAFVQYNNQLDNLNINTRFQWRFAPVSDFFLVYTDNYSTNPFDTFNSRNRALVAKVTYWLNP